LSIITFASTSEGKAREIASILSNYEIKIKFAKLSLTEIQSDSLEEIAKSKLEHAHSIVSGPVMVEDDGLFIKSLNGFPGQYSSFVFGKIGNDGILRLLQDCSDRSASFRAVIAYRDNDTQLLFEGEVHGQIAEESYQGGWGYDPIFRPNGCDLTFSQMGKKKLELSHRRKAVEKFATAVIDGTIG